MARAGVWTLQAFGYLSLGSQVIVGLVLQHLFLPVYHLGKLFAPALYFNGFIGLHLKAWVLWDSSNASTIIDSSSSTLSSLTPTQSHPAPLQLFGPEFALTRNGFLNYHKGGLLHHLQMTRDVLNNLLWRVLIAYSPDMKKKQVMISLWNMLKKNTGSKY